MMRWETHAHTTEGSACAASSGAEMANACKAAGYDGLFVTDHFYHGNTAVPRDLPWEEWVRRFALGYRHAKEMGDAIGLQVRFGWEYTWEGNDFLAYGLSPEWLAQHPETITLPPYEYLQMVRAAGAFVVHAHPFRQEWYVKTIRLVPNLVDAVERFNGRNGEEAFNERAAWYADSYGLPVTSGSDAHAADEFRGGVLLPQMLETPEDYGQMVRTSALEGLIVHGEDCFWEKDAR